MWRSRSRTRPARRAASPFRDRRSTPTRSRCSTATNPRRSASQAGDVARGIILELIAPDEDEQPSTSPRCIDDFDHFACRRSLGPSALALVHAAEARDIPWVRLNDASLIQVGQGKYQKRIEAALTSQTSHTAVEIAADKELCTRLLSDLGLPVPKQFLVRDAEDAVDAANAIGYPVVVKPVDGNHGRGVVGQPDHRRRGRGRLRDRRAAKAAAWSSRA